MRNAVLEAIVDFFLTAPAFERILRKLVDYWSLRAGCSKNLKYSIRIKNSVGGWYLLIRHGSRSYGSEVTSHNSILPTK